MAVYRKAVVIYNPYAGGLRGKRRKRLDEAVQTLQADGHGVTLQPTQGPGSAGRIARAAIDSGADLILPAGGDGTVNEILPAVAQTTTPLGILPAGTANVLACELGVPRKAKLAAAALKDMVPMRVALGRLNAGDKSRYFLLMAGAGFDAHIVYNLNLGLKYKAGEVAYWGGALRQIGRRLEEFDIEVDGRCYRSSFALISRVRNYGGYLEVASGANLASDDFEVVLFEGSSAFRFYAVYLPAIVAGRAAGVRGLTFVRAKHICLKGAEGTSVYVQVDGEYAGRLPASIDIVPDALTLLVPPSFRAR